MRKLSYKGVSSFPIRIQCSFAPVVRNYEMDDMKVQYMTSYKYKSKLYYSAFTLNHNI